jgi:phosphate transport system substrate-binding protein
MRAILFLAMCMFSAPALARDQIRVVGSSTVFPFVAAAAEQFGRAGTFRTPIVESTGTGGGIAMFCSGLGDEYPDMVNASRQIKPGEIEQCSKNGITRIVELKIGYDGIAIANARSSPVFNLTRESLFLALARQVPVEGVLAPNPYTRWREIDTRLPDVPIAVYGPPPTSGTRDAFAELVMVEGCKQFPEYAHHTPDPEARKKECMMMREDGRFIEAGENDNLIVQKLTGNPQSIGLFGYSFLEQNAGLVKANPVDGVLPDFSSIVSGRYEIARSLFVYLKPQQNVPGLKEFAILLTSDAAVGVDGFLVLKGLLPLPPAEHAQMKITAAELR